MKLCPLAFPWVRVVSHPSIVGVFMGPKRQKRPAPASSRAPSPPPLPQEVTPASLGIHGLTEKQVSNFERNRKRALIPNRYLDFGMLDTLGLRTDVEWLAERLGWSTFLKFREPTFTGLTLEFASTIEAQIFHGPACSAGLCKFQLDNVSRELTLAEISEIFGFPDVTDFYVPRGETQVDFL